MTGLYSLTLLLSAGLLFAIQPMIAKAVLPALGGSPSVWTTCLAFFQLMLLCGYGYAYLLSRMFQPRGQAVAHLLVGLAQAVPLEIGVDLPNGAHLFPRPAASSDPAMALLTELLIRVGPSLLFVSATAPLLQGWYAAARGKPRDPYFLYAASNLGSLVALLAYPLVIEPQVPLTRQADAWVMGLHWLWIMVAACAVARWVSRRGAVGPLAPEIEPEPLEPIGMRKWLTWATLAAVPASLLSGATQYITQDLAAVPLLWVVPLSLYLLTYIAAFARRPWFDPALAGRLYPFALMALGPALAAGLVHPFWLWLPLHLLAFTLAALGCHGALARSRPSTRHLTAFYLAVAAGGAAGGLFNALLAPILFDRAVEYPLVLVLAALVLPILGEARPPGPWRFSDVLLPATIFLLIAPLARDLGGFADSAAGALVAVPATGLVLLSCWTYRSRPARFALSFGAAVAACGLWDGRDGRALLRHRDFYGIVRVTHDARARCVRLFHGSTLHGEQSLDPTLRREPRAYFDRTGPAGDIFDAIQDRPEPRHIAIVGLGCGTLAAYARPGERWMFYELDPAVIRIAGDPRLFTYLSDCRADSLDLVAGDARLRLAEAPDGSFDAIVLDAFGSDAVPVHLLTREALAMYRRKLAPGGRLAFNLTNRYLDLDSVLGALASDAGMACRVRYDVDVPRAVRASTGKQPTIWAVVAASEADLGLIATDPRWRPARVLSVVPAWTDESSNLFRSLALDARHRRRADTGGPSG